MPDQELTPLTDPDNFAVVWDDPDVADALPVDTEWSDAETADAEGGQ